MSDRFQPVTMESLCAWIFGEWENRRSIFGIPRDQFFIPKPDDPFRTRVFDQALDTPFGVAAGPHSQMAQNIIVAWLCGARFMELKTIQTLDELEVSKPCIDMQDAGYNVEWSQELKVHESYAEYLRAWVLIHVLHRMLDFPGESPGVILNMSVGYDMKGILQPNVQSFLTMMGQGGERIQDYLNIIERYVPGASKIPVPSRLSDNVTLSTMHGCPPEEIGVISKYLMKERGLHTYVKCNPTLLGPTRLRDILNVQLGYQDVEVPDIAFQHDLKYDDAIALLSDLRKTADACGVRFGVKLSNTLEVVNKRDVFSPNEKMMYLSGRPLHALTVNLAAQLDDAFGGKLPMSFAGGADALNAPRLLACGMQTVTVCSDLLRTGGYLRLRQYLDTTRAAMEAVGATNLNQLCCKTARQNYGFAAALCAESDSSRACPRLNLKDYADAVIRDAALHRDTYDRKRTKTTRALGPLDCIQAPCTDECPINQQVPEYMNLVREGRWDEAATITRADNPLPSILGRACNHLCECVCIRTHLDEPLAIREIKRAIMDHERDAGLKPVAPTRPEKIAIIGAGPCGLSVAYFLTLAGYAVEIFEARPYAGGMVSGTIPGYRAAMDKVRYDMDLVVSLGAKVHYNCRAGKDITLAQVRERGFAAVVVAAGAQRGGRLGVEGENLTGVYDALDFLRMSREEHPPQLGQTVAVVGGGDVAMDCARTARRLGASGVQIVYRRTLAEMPASRDELRELLEENLPIVELTAPKRILAENGSVKALVCTRMELGEPDASGRRRPVEIPGSEFELPVDQVVVAVNQQADLSFFGDEKPEVNRSGFIAVDAAMRTSLPGVYAGGDIGPQGPASIVKALGDGRRIAAAIRRACEGKTFASPGVRHGTKALDEDEFSALLRRRATRVPRVPVPHRDPEKRIDFDEVILTMPDDAAQAEAARCLDCHKLCSLCVGVCPNMALFTYRNTLAGKVPGANQAYQVAVLTDFCNECGNCVTFCPTAGRPYRDKPRLYLNLKEFEGETDNAYRVVRQGDRWTIHARWQGNTVAWSDEDAKPAPDPVMAVLLHALKTDMPYFPVAEKTE
ncbi:MAG TPA: FAD-dependent oxidoreductase [Kiritimatiellia bacterium]|nr:FAD-dependent oxidoreductase [Kiritimatiellia bacterium]HMP00110.1 FAD-dependent oxidoreductase [Kiritimatiellia bacterium]HMP96571.1 FAD-dependent oxidoreductase [Kiritimatiellia bacterium]